MNEQMYFKMFGLVFKATGIYEVAGQPGRGKSPAYNHLIMDLAEGPETATPDDYIALDVAMEMKYGPACGLQRNDWGIYIDGEPFHVELRYGEDYIGTDNVQIGSRPQSSDHQISEKIFLASKAGKTIEKRDLSPEDLANLEQFKTAWPRRLNGIDASANFDKKTKILNVAGHGYVGMPWNVRPAPQTNYTLPEFVVMVNEWLSKYSYAYKGQLLWLVRNGYLVKNEDETYAVA